MATKTLTFLIMHIRRIVYWSTLLIVLGVILSTKSGTSPLLAQYTDLSETFALLALWYLYAALLVSPLYNAFPSLPFKPLYVKARRAIGNSVFVFALLHGLVTFFGVIGGFKNLGLIPSSYVLPLLLGTLSLLILTILASTSFDSIVRSLGVRWKQLHRIIYIAGIFILIHAYSLGADFVNKKDVGVLFFSLAFALLFFLEFIRLDHYITHRFNSVPRYSVVSLLTILMLIYGVYYLFLS